MKIYEARIYSDNIQVKGYEIEKDTGKQIRYGRNEKINKSVIGKCNCIGTGYGYTSDEAIQAVKNNINNQILEYKNKIKYLESKLTLPLKEVK